MLELAHALYPVWVALFMAVFIAIIVWALWPSRRQRDRMHDNANIPFREEGRNGKAR